MVRIGIVGGTGYTGVELLRLLAQHPAAELVAITSRKETGRPVADMFPSLRGRVSLAYTDPAVADLSRCDLVFFATPNAVAMNQVEPLLDRGVRVIDLSADFRILDVAEWEKWYGTRHACPHLLAQAVYGLPEVNRDSLRAARLVANPGCYPTAVQLGLLPLVESGLVDLSGLVADAKSGVSGAGRKLDLPFLYSEASENFSAYGVGGHRHWPEIRQGLARAAGGPVDLTFVPHLTPMVRGIHATLYARIAASAASSAGTDASRFQRLYEERFRDEPFVDVMPPGSHPDTRSVRAANLCRIAVHRPHGAGTLVVLSVIDNLVKGAAGQAIQNMNIMFGLPETQGLAQVPVVP